MPGMTTENKEPDKEQSAEMVAAAEPGARGRTAGLALTGPDGLLKQSPPGPCREQRWTRRRASIWAVRNTKSPDQYRRPSA